MATHAPAYRSNRGRKPQGPKPEPKILFQEFFKSVGPRTYVAQVKEAANGNHFVVLTEGKRDEKTNELRKSRVFVYSEDFSAFFKMVQTMAHFVKDHPVSPAVKAKRDKVWAKQRSSTPAAELPAPETPAAADDTLDE